LDIDLENPLIRQRQRKSPKFVLRILPALTTLAAAQGTAFGGAGGHHSALGTGHRPATIAETTQHLITTRTLLTPPLTLSSAPDFGYLHRMPEFRAHARIGSPTPKAAKNPVTRQATPAAVTAAVPASDITLDNTLVTPQPVPFINHTFAISSNLGKQVGGNLFYSFRTFTLGTGDIASFSGPSTANDVFVRVTGNNLSNIDGTIACTIPNAGIFFMNPAGITFTANASLKLQGPFALTTADYIRFSDDQRFAATNPGSSASLSTAAPVAFGFLATLPAGVSITGAVLQPADGSALLAVGGPLQLDAGTLACAGGRVSVGSVASAGEVAFDQSMNILPVAAPSAGGITLMGGAAISSDGATGGSVSIMCGSLSIVEGSRISADMSGPGAGGNIAIATTSLSAINGLITASSTGGGNAGSVIINGAGSVRLVGSSVNAQAPDASGGDIAVLTPALTLSDGSRIYAAGLQAGKVTISASGNIALSGNSSISTDTVMSSPGGSDVTITAGQLTLSGGLINADTSGSGTGGDVSLHVSGPIVMNADSSITASTSGIGKGGSVMISGLSLSLDRGNIAASSTGAGPGGNINIDATAMLSISAGAIHAGSLQTGGGDVVISAGNISMSDGASITAAIMGAGAVIAIRSHRNLRVNSSIIAAEGSNADISLVASKFMLFDSSDVTAAALHNGARILIDPEYVVVQRSTIAARALGRDVAVLFARSVVFAQSGNSQILSTGGKKARMLDVSGAILELRSTLPQPTLLLLAPVCAPHLEADFSSFVVTGISGRPPGPDGWMPDLIVAEDDKLLREAGR
jgi:filamentous hemagglutinin family protein